MLFLKALLLMIIRPACLIYREQMLFENKKHEGYTVNKHKIVLNKDDVKRVAQAN